jgi:hypothetical protein
MSSLNGVARAGTGFLPVKAIGVALTLGLAAVLTQLRPSELAPNAGLVVQLLIGEAGWWFLGLGVLAWVIRSEGEHVSSIGLQRVSGPAILWGIGGFFGLLALFILAQTLIAAVGAKAPTAATSFAPPREIRRNRCLRNRAFPRTALPPFWRAVPRLFCQMSACDPLRT